MIDARQLTKRYGAKTAVDGLDFLDVSPGTTLAPTRQAWYAGNADYRYAPTGSDITRRWGLR